MAHTSGGQMKWAVVVGIDQYSDNNTNENLRGCANDAALVYRFLQQCLAVPPQNIKLHMAPCPVALQTTKDLSKTVSTLPKRENFITSIKEISNQAQTGDLIFVHFSGHGDRVPTQYVACKSAGAMDEKLCFLDGEIADVEFGEMMDDLATGDRNVLVTLDCCFSGGATRANRGSMTRCRSRNMQLLNEELLQPQQRGSNDQKSPSRGSRHAQIDRDSWLYRNREYNVIAACQPYEEAIEKTNSSGNWGGALTSELVDLLTSWQARWQVTTYAQVQRSLEIAIKDRWRNNQRPMIIGESRRVLFQREVIEDTDLQVARVVSVNQDHVVIDQGELADVHLGDRYDIKDPLMDRSTLPSRDGAIITGESIEIEITSVGTISSTAIICHNRAKNAQVVHPGWFAYLIGRASSVYAYIKFNETESEQATVAAIHDTWTSYFDAASPVRLVFRKPQDLGQTQNITFHVVQEGDILVVQNELHEPFKNLPVLTMNSLDLPLSMMRLLQHLNRFLTVRKMKRENSQQPPPYKLSFQPIPNDADDIASSWKIEFTNLHSATLHLNILNLTPLHGISRLIPDEEDYTCKSVPRGESFEFEFDICVPESLQDDYHHRPQFEMRDIMKVFITTEPASFKLFEMPDLDPKRPQFRHAKPRGRVAVDKWFVEEKEIITLSPNK